MQAKNNSNKGVATTNTVFGVIELLHERPKLTVTDIADEMGMAKSTIHDHLASLHAKQYVVKDEKARYSLSLKFLSLGVQARNRNTIDHGRVVQTHLENLAVDTSLASWFMVEEHGKAVYTSVAEGERAVPTDGRVGKRGNIHALAGGKAILAFLPDERIEEIIDMHGLPRLTENTITKGHTLIEHLEGVRESGIALNKEESSEGVWATGAPVLIDGTVYGSVSISGPKRRLKSQLDNIEEHVRDAANAIELTIVHSDKY